MKRLSDEDINNMITGGASEANNPKSHIKIKIPKSPFVPVKSEIDCHGKTTEQVWQEILKQLYLHQATSFYFRIISGRSGVLRNDIENWLGKGILSKFVINFELENPGSFLVRFKFPKDSEIIRNAAGAYKIMPK